MTTSVDVLAVLDKCHDALECGGLRHVLAESIAAVAELIEAAEKYHKARNIQQRVDSSARLVSAIARVKGA